MHAVHTPFKVLYVEDHPVNVQLMQALFAHRPEFELTVATTGEAGFHAAVESPPDLLLLDLNLPDCHGAQLLERLRGQAGLTSVPAIAVTADMPRLEGTTFLELWQKPLDLQAILKRLDQLQHPPAALLAEVGGHLGQTYVTV